MMYESRKLRRASQLPEEWDRLTGDDLYLKRELHVFKEGV